MNDPLIEWKKKSSEETRIIANLLACFFISQLLFYNIASFLPTFVENNFPGITSF